MSQIYNTEPPTKGKVILKTTLGDIDIELWPKEAPKAVRNFVQLCMEGYYNKTVFHRVIKDFMVQGGDPTGTGKGGESIYGHPFKDEFHSRIKFNHRGQVASANENQPHTNSSQFFITLEACPHLDRKHTIFGRVVGDSIYNVAHFNQLQTDNEDRPNELPILLDTEILWNPFDDILPRTTPEEREAEEEYQREEEAAKARLEKKKRKRNLGLLSFGQEAGEEDAELQGNNIRLTSVFESAPDDDSRLVKEGTDTAARLAEQEEAEYAQRKKLRASIKASLTKGDDAEESVDIDMKDAEVQDLSFADKMRAKIQKQKAQHSTKHEAEANGGSEAGEAGSDDEESNGKHKQRRRDRQQEALDAGTIRHAHVKPSKLLAKQDTNLMSDFEKKRLEAKERSKLAKEKGNNMAKLLAFKKQLATGRAVTATSTAIKNTKLGGTQATQASETENGKVEDEPDQQLPAAWRIDKFLDNYEDEKVTDLMGHRLEFAKDQVKSDLMARNHDDDYDVFDPLQERNEKWNRKEGAEKRRNREWAADMEGPLD